MNLPMSKMEKTGDFSEIIKNLEEPIRTYIKKMDFPYPFAIHINKAKNIAEETNKLLDDFAKKIPETFGSGIHYIAGELADNVEQHSNYSNAFIFLKYTLKLKQLELGIFDDGLTIPFVFEEDKIGFLKDSEAIKMALEGKTTKKEDITRGFGLKTCREIVKVLHGEMHIFSRNAMLVIKDTEVQNVDFEKGILKGTLVYVKLKTPRKVLNIYPYLE